MVADEIATALRQRLAIPDAQFDALFPPSQRFRSEVHWTPIDVALRACAWLAPRSDERVLDVGAGVGKVCLVGALATDASWVGVEIDPQMIRVGNAVARRLRVSDRVRFVRRDANSIDWATFDAVYMFNPFAEGLFSSDLDHASRHTRHTQTIERARLRMASLRRGARLVTYHGFGGELPEGFDLV